MLRPTQPSASQLVPPTEVDIQTPMTIQASSPIFQNTSGMSNYGFNAGFRPEFEGTKTDESGTTFKNVQFSNEKERALIQTYLERVNPRYPFIYEEHFLEWYSSWKDLQQVRCDTPAGEQWMSFFIQMAFAVSLLLAPQVSPEERRLSNVSGPCKSPFLPVTEIKDLVLDCTFVFELCL